MSDAHWENLKEIFHAAIALPAQERGVYLDRACDGDAELRRAVESLLKSHEETGFVDKPAYEAAADMLMADGTLTAGQMVGRYRIISLIGEGGMGRVYLADDTKLHRKVSLKFLSTSVTEDRQRLRRFEQEARAASALNHPNIITIHEIGEDYRHPFIATEYIEGQTLRERLRSPLDRDESLEIAIQVASALVAAHRVNIVHRDIKPENVMIRKDDGLVKVLDFGLAKVTQERQRNVLDSKLNTVLMANTAPGIVIGTVAYMSPEQARGEMVDERTDIWSLGVVLYELVAGCSPFVAGTSNEIVSGILSKQTAPPLARYAHSVPERLEEIVGKALAKNRDERYQTSKDLLIDLKRLQQTLQLKAASERSTSPDKFVPAATDGVAAVSKSETTAATTSTASSAEYIVNQIGSHKRAVSISLALMLLILSGTFFYGWQFRQITKRQSSIASIAVLPFVNASSDPDTEFISDGITDNIIESLSRLPNLRVMSHSAVFHYKNRHADPHTIASELAVEAVLTGRLTKRNDALTISIELVNGKDNSHIWGRQYDRKLSELLALQQEIPLDVSESLRLKLSGESKERLARAHTANAEAYNLYLKGRVSWEKWTLEGAKQAIEYFDEAIKKDPNYALAYAGLADAYMFGNFPGGRLPQKESHRRGREAAMKALSLDPQLGEAHAALGLVLLYDWDFTGAEREFKRGLDLNPSHAEGHHEYSHLLLLLGRFDESLVESKKYLELDPVSESPLGHLAYYYLYTRQYDEAIRQFQKDFQLHPDAYQHFHLAWAYYGKGMFTEAVDSFLTGFARNGYASEKIAALKEAFAKSGIKGFLQEWIAQLKAGPQTEQDHVDIAALYARLNEKEHAFEWLEKAYAEHADGLVRLKEEVGFDSLRSDPRYADLLRRVGLPP